MRSSLNSSGSSRLASLFALALGSGLAAAGGLSACSNSTMDDLPPGLDAGRDGSDSGDASQRPRGHCSAVQGPACDLVLQDCAQGRECIVSNGDAGLTTVCSEPSKGDLKAGAACCPGQGFPCAAGLECIGKACSGTPGAAPTGRCTPHCCPDDDSPCGVSTPEGSPGVCDLQVSTDIAGKVTPLYYVCSYKPACKPFRIQPCPSGDTCLFQKERASYRCGPVEPPPGKTSGECKLANECADGYACLGPGESATCRMLCYHKGAGSPPFDPSAVRDEPLYGGCPSGTTCSGTVTGFPAYLGYCR